ncbi:MAG: B12-binding domain-containing radical SAM protein [Bacteroidota bacterium]|nr:B12-binding domain-containing radical SAM protein [Bacteroidota bacterium]
MKNVLLTHSYFLQLDKKQKKLGQPYAPLGTLYAAALLRQNYIPVSVFDVMFARHPDEVIPSLETQHPDYFIIYDDGFNYLTKMCLTNMREAAFRMIQLAKERACTVIVSSSDSADHYEKYLDAGADFVLLGEAEQTLLDLVQSLNKNENVEHIQGIVFKKENHLIKTQKRAVLKDLDSLPFPAWDLIDIEPYRQSWMKHTGYFSINIATTRGCPYKCNWCAKPIYGNRYNARSPQNVVDELLLLNQKFHFDHIWFCDDIFGLKPGWVHEFAALVQQHELHLKFKIQSRADLLVQENYVASLAKAGCENVWMGAESGSQKILDAMDKGITIGQIAEATALLKAHNIKPSFFIQFGYLGETKEDITLTIQMINRLLPHEIGISVSYPLPGTKFYEKVKEQLKDKANWSDSDDLAMLFRNQYHPSFYKQLHRYVHKSYRKHLAIDNMLHLIREPFKLRFKTLKKILSGIYYIPATYLEKKKLDALQHAV